MGQREKILVFLLGSLGDSIVAIPALRVVRQNFRNAEIVALHESGLGLVEPHDLLPNDLVDRYFSYKRGRSAAFSITRSLPQLRREKFDAAVYLVFSERPPRSVDRDRMFFRAAGIRKLIGFHSFTTTDLYPRDENGMPAKVPSEAERKVSRLAIDGLWSETDIFALPWIKSSPSELTAAKTWLREALDHKLTLAMAPGCKTKANQWAVENFMELIRSVRTKVDCAVVIVGGPEEAKMGDLFGRDIDECANAAGKYSVREMGALLRLCDGYVGLDTGTTHLAAAVGIPVVAIYGQRNNPGQWFPHTTNIEIVQNEVPCAGCREQTCPVTGHPCMSGINVDAVANAVGTMLLKASRADPEHATEAA